MKVRALRRSVQEVNAIIETERSVKSEKVVDSSQPKTDTFHSRKQSKNDGKQPIIKNQKVSIVSSSQEQSTKNSVSFDQNVERSSNFRAILTRFNNIGQAGSSNSNPNLNPNSNPNSNSNSSTKEVPNFPRQRSTFYLQQEETNDGSDTRM